MDSVLKYATEPLRAMTDFVLETPMHEEIFIEPGTAHQDDKYLERDIAAEVIRRLSQRDRNPQSLYFIGYIIYEDVLGGKRRMGFCRRYDETTERFITVNDPNYEYEE